MTITILNIEYVACLQSMGAVMFLDTWYPTQGDLELYPHNEMAYRHHWNPHQIQFLRRKFGVQEDIEGKNAASFLWLCSLCLSQCTLWDLWSPLLSNFRFRDGSMASGAILMFCISESWLYLRTGACKRVQDMTQSSFDMRRRQISLPLSANGMRRFSERDAPVMTPSLSMICRCGLILWLKIALCPPPPVAWPFSNTVPVRFLVSRLFLLWLILPYRRQS